MGPDQLDHDDDDDGDVSWYIWEFLVLKYMIRINKFSSDEQNLPDESVCACPILDRIWKQNLNLVYRDSFSNSHLIVHNFNKYVP